MPDSRCIGHSRPHRAILHDSQPVRSCPTSHGTRHHDDSPDGDNLTKIDGSSATLAIVAAHRHLQSIRISMGRNRKSIALESSSLNPIRSRCVQLRKLSNPYPIAGSGIGYGPPNLPLKTTRSPSTGSDLKMIITRIIATNSSLLCIRRHIANLIDKHSARLFSRRNRCQLPNGLNPRMQRHTGATHKS